MRLTPALYVTLVFVNQNFFSGVENLDEAVVVLLRLVDGLVHRLVVPDPLPSHNILKLFFPFSSSRIMARKIS